MKNANTTRNIEAKRRSLLAMTSGIAGLAATTHWSKPIVKSALLPVHAQTTSPPVISNFQVSQIGECQTDPVRYFFEINFDYTAPNGLVSLVVDATCDAGDAMIIIDGDSSGLGLGDNILPANDSFILTGNEFSGHAQLTSNRIQGTSPLECLLTLTLTDANGGQDIEQVDFSECAFGP